MYDFSGYATKNDIVCSDGRVIKQDAFKHNDNDTVPLVWQHMHNTPENVLGHAVLENREDGVYARCKFNNTTAGKNAKELVEHGDINSLSIYANKLVQEGNNVIHGNIREVSLVLSGANPGALIDNVDIRHSDGVYHELDDEAIIYTGQSIKMEEFIEHKDDGGEDKKDKEEKEGDEETVGSIFDTLSEKQKEAVYYMITKAVEDNASLQQSDINGEEDSMNGNVFEQYGKHGKREDANTLSHSQIETIFKDAQRSGSLRESFMAHAQDYGIENIDYLFPDAKSVTPKPEMISRRMEWVSGVLSGVSKTPFSRIKSLAADITEDEARAKGYIKGNKKVEEVFKLLKRTTSPTTIYKKQKLDRDDIIDITDLDVVAWLKAEMRVMLDEEIARAILIGDGREVMDDDKINEENIRPIANDDDLYAHKVGLAPNVSGNTLIETILRTRKHYKGSGRPTFYTTDDILTDLLLLKDKMGRRLYATEAELAAALRVKEIVPVEPMEDVPNLLGIMVNLGDYKLGADKGGETSMFDDFDIDYNQYKYLIETRLSGALYKPKSALVFIRNEGTEVSPEDPTFNENTGVITIPDVNGVIYTIDGVEVGSGAQPAIGKGETVEVEAEPAEGYYFPHNTQVSWVFSRPE